VPTIFSQMHGNAIRPAQFRQHCGMNRVRFIGDPGLPHRGDMIDVNSKKWHA
jgi:hypothetical protein